MEAINDSTKLIAQAIEFLKTVTYENIDNETSTLKAIELLKTALDKLAVVI